MKYNRLILLLLTGFFISCQEETTVKNEPIKEEPIDSLSIETPLLDDINDILLISTPLNLPRFELLLKDDNQWSIRFSYVA